MSRTQFLQVPYGMGAKNDDMVKKFELLINVVIADKRKATVNYAWTKMVRGMDRVLGFHPAQSTIPPADRQNLSHRIELKDYGNPDCLHRKWKVSSNLSRQSSREVMSEKANAVL